MPRETPQRTIDIGDGLVVTPRVARRLRRSAEAEIPLPPPLAQLQFMKNIALPIGAVVLFIILMRLSFDRFDSGEWPGWLGYAVTLGGGIGAPMAILFVLERLMAPMATEHAGAVHARELELARERRDRTMERDRFYSSSEWLALRAQVISENGAVCSLCRRSITPGEDLTVDHIRPRSRFPDLALSRENMQVLCRSCNSSKGVR